MKGNIINTVVHNCHGKNEYLAAKENYPRETEKTHGKKKNLAAKRKPRGKKKNLAAKGKRLTANRKRLTAKRKRLTAKNLTAKNLTAKRKTSQQKEKDSRKKRKTDSRPKKRGHGGWPSFSKYSMGKKSSQKGGDRPTRLLSHVFVSRLISKS